MARGCISALTGLEFREAENHFEAQGAKDAVVSAAGALNTLAPSLLKIQSSNAEQEEATEELDVDYNDAPLEIGFNVSYLLDVLANLKVDVIKAEFGDSNSSALISLPGDETFKYVIMPMRI